MIWIGRHHAADALAGWTLISAWDGACASLGQQTSLGTLAALAGKLQSMSQDIGKHSSNAGA
jgi:formate dehydrogenase assembly factor FdhD